MNANRSPLEKSSHPFAATRKRLPNAAGAPAWFFSLPELARSYPKIQRLPVSMRIVLEAVLRHCDGRRITPEHVKQLANWQPKTANVPTDFPYEDFKDIYRYAHQQGLKGCTTFRFNPAAFQGVLVKEADLENTLYRFELEDGSMVEVKGNEQIEYDGELHTAANLFDALKEGYYGKF